MNRMNLPPPFEELEAEFPALKEAYDIEKYNDIFIKESLYTKGNKGNEIIFFLLLMLFFKLYIYLMYNIQ